MLGSGSIVVMDETTDIVKAAWRLARFFARESCGKCTPCREGTSWLDKVMRRIVDGIGRPEDLELLRDVCDNIAPGLSFPYPMTTICFLGPSAAMPIISALQMFPEEFERAVAGAVRERSLQRVAGRRGPVRFPTRARPAQPSRRSRSPSTVGRSRRTRASCSSPRPSAAASTSPASAGTPA